MIAKVRQNLAIHHLKNGVIASPTDTVCGLLCLPYNLPAVKRILRLKRRSISKGLILLACDIRYFYPFVAHKKDLASLTKSAKKPTTYLLKASSHTPRILSGGFDTIALRLTNHPLIKTLCEATDSALVATSANISGKPCAQNILRLKVFFKQQLDFIITPKNDSNIKPSAIINLLTGERLR